MVPTGSKNTLRTCNSIKCLAVKGVGVSINSIKGHKRVTNGSKRVTKGSMMTVKG